MGSSLDPTFGFWLVVIWLQTLLQGCGILQCWLYFHWYAHDHWGVKVLVAVLLAIETLQIVDFFQITYFYFIDGFGNIPGLFVIHWQDSVQLIATYLCGFLVQMFFGYCVYALNRKNKILPVIIAVLGLSQMALGIVTTVQASNLGSFTELGNPRLKVANAFQATVTLSCDILITGSLMYCISKRKRKIPISTHIFTKLVLIAVNRGVLTALCALLNLILFFARPGTFYFFIGLELSGKLYLNSALATLNSRQHIANIIQPTAEIEWSPPVNIQMDDISRTAHTSIPSIVNQEDQEIVKEGLRKNQGLV